MTAAEPVIAARLRAAGCLFAEDEARLLVSAAIAGADLETMTQQRVGGLPLEHILGWAEFCGVRVAVDPGVFVPRARSEFLVRQAASLAPPAAVVVDLCCGSGAVGFALAMLVPDVTLHAVDIDAAAVRCASRNVSGAGRQVYLGDLYEPLPRALRGNVDVLVANAPYVPTVALATMPQEARLHEPRVALDGGRDGLAVQRRVAAGAPAWLRPGGHLLIETSRNQAAQTAAAITAAGLRTRVTRDEELEATVVVGTAPTGRRTRGRQ